ncbi:uncharacterized protein LOC111300833 [Durio zibethinus]|uniref:Uncharacterized protein LOC111300833 n=1 Tax=Durio zibethinus TaxID=66656 RepID=A0A6P5ZI05_DURZI|nr:uncharacterized protein LOC111300833 [Durio zibethinus]
MVWWSYLQICGKTFFLFGKLNVPLSRTSVSETHLASEIRHKATSETPFGESIYSHSSLNGSFLVGNSNLSGGLLPSIKKNLEQGGNSRSSVFHSVDSNRSSEMGIPPVHPHSSQVARKILDHLQRNGHNSLPYLGFDSSKSKDQINNGSPAQWNEDRENSFSVPSPEIAIEAKNVRKTSSASDLLIDSTITMFSNNARFLLDFGKTHDSQIKTAHKDLSKVTDAAVSGGLLKHSSNTLGNKLVLASISVSKPKQRWMFTSDNSTGFTFPISASSGVSSEPLTPSIMPSLSGNCQLQPKEENTRPYSFATNHVDASDINFNFGSDRSSRISFSSIGQNTICY